MKTAIEEWIYALAWSRVYPIAGSVEAHNAAEKAVVSFAHDARGAAMVENHRSMLADMNANTALIDRRATDFQQLLGSLGEESFDAPGDCACPKCSAEKKEARS